MNGLRNEGMGRCPAQRPTSRPWLLSLNPPYKILFYPPKKPKSRNEIHMIPEILELHSEYVTEKE